MQCKAQVMDINKLSILLPCLTSLKKKQRLSLKWCYQVFVIQNIPSKVIIYTDTIRGYLGRDFLFWKSFNIEHKYFSLLSFIDLLVVYEYFLLIFGLLRVDGGDIYQRQCSHKKKKIRPGNIVFFGLKETTNKMMILCWVPWS